MMMMATRCCGYNKQLVIIIIIITITTPWVNWFSGGYIMMVHIYRSLLYIYIYKARNATDNTLGKCRAALHIALTHESVVLVHGTKLINTKYIKLWNTPELAALGM